MAGETRQITHAQIEKLNRQAQAKTAPTHVTCTVNGTRFELPAEDATVWELQYRYRMNAGYGFDVFIYRHRWGIWWRRSKFSWCSDVPIREGDRFLMIARHVPLRKRLELLRDTT